MPEISVWKSFSQTLAQSVNTFLGGAYGVQEELTHNKTHMTENTVKQYDNRSKIYACYSVAQRMGYYFLDLAYSNGYIDNLDLIQCRNIKVDRQAVHDEIRDNETLNLKPFHFQPVVTKIFHTSPAVIGDIVNNAGDPVFPQEQDSTLNAFCQLMAITYRNAPAEDVRNFEQMATFNTTISIDKHRNKKERRPVEKTIYNQEMYLVKAFFSSNNFAPYQAQIKNYNSPDMDEVADWAVQQYRPTPLQLYQMHQN